MQSVSAIVPAYNARPFIRTAITSALNQTQPPIEIIVVDDGSTDGTLEELHAFGEAITILRQSNGGAASARNTGARVARGEWLAFLDADDEWLPDKLARQLAVCDDEAVLVYSDRFNIGARGDLPELQSVVQTMYEGDVFEHLLMLGNVITTSSVLIRADAFHALGGFSERKDILPAEDWDLWVRVAAEHRVQVCREPLVRYRFHAAGMSQSLQKMNGARARVTERALSLPRGKLLGATKRRRVWGQTWLANACDCARHRRRGPALAGFARSAACWPLAVAPYREFVKICIGRQ